MNKLLIFIFLFLSACSSSPNSVVKKADKLIEKNKINDAIILYQKAIQDNPDEAVFYINQAALFRDQKKYANAIRNYQVVKNLNPKSLWPYIGLGRIYTLQKKFEDARSILKTAVQEFPKDGTPYFYLGIVYFELKDGDAALENFNKAMDNKYKNQHETYYYRGITFEELIKNKDRAKFDYQSYLMLKGGTREEDVKTRLGKLDVKRYEF